MFKSGHNTDCLRLFQPGDKVLIRKHNPRNKIDDHYKAEIHSYSKET